VLLCSHGVCTTVGHTGYIGKRHIANAIQRLEEEGLLNVTSRDNNNRVTKIKIELLRVPFFLEPEYNNLRDDFWEVWPDELRMSCYL
jgi:hypothetical protein